MASLWKWCNFSANNKFFFCGYIVLRHIEITFLSHFHRFRFGYLFYINAIHLDLECRCGVIKVCDIKKLSFTTRCLSIRCLCLRSLIQKYMLDFSLLPFLLDGSFMKTQVTIVFSWDYQHSIGEKTFVRIYRQV